MLTMGRYPSIFVCNYKNKIISAWLLFFTLFGQLTFLEFILPKIVDAAVVIIDGSVSTTATEHLFSGSQLVFVSDQVGYKFYVDSTGVCVYSKTINGGTSWGAAVTVDSQTDCTSIVVWYDRWTPGDSGDFIHISTMDIGNDDLWYNRLDTTSDTLQLGSSPISTIVNSGQTPTYVAGTNEQAVSKGTDGALYMTASAGDSFVVLAVTLLVAGQKSLILIPTMPTTGI
jgi:hypothetical protein